MDDLISRQQAIEVVQNRHMMLSKEKVLLINDLEKLPSAEPEIIRCQNCESYQENFHWCKLHDGEFSLTDFCSYAERRTDEQTD